MFIWFLVILHCDMEYKVNTHSLLIKTDATSVQIFQQDYLLAGVGQALHIYSIPENVLISTLHVLEGQRIHGFRVALPSANVNSNTTCVAMFGGKLISICNVSIKLSEEKPVCHVTHNLSKCLKFNDWIINVIWIKKNNKLAVLTAHNILQICDIESGCIEEFQYGCEEKCILYSGHLLEVADHIVVFGGTAFSQVVIWNTNSERVHHRLTGHKGVIFSVSYNEEKNVIVTTSDDRSIRVWSVLCDSKNTVNFEYWEKCAISLDSTLFGHTARVMQHKFIGDYIVSIGEDTMVCIWNLRGDLISKRKVCPNGVLWCVDCDLEKKLIIVGGGDSGISLLPLVTNENIPTTINFPDENLSAKRIVLTARGNIVCVTENGNIFYYDFTNERWNLIHTIPSSKSYLCISMCKQFVAVVTMDGFIDIFLESCKSDALLTHYLSDNLSDQTKIFSVHWVYDRRLVVCNSNGVVTVLGPQSLNKSDKLMSFEIPKCKQRWLTAAALDPCRKNILIVGDRCGSLHMFRNGNYYAVQSLNRLHGNIGVNVIQFSGDKLITAGRDGVVKMMSLKEQNNEVQLHFLYNIKTPFDWIEKFLDKDCNIVCGFRETNLVIWNMKDCCNVIDLSCGGGHRSWDLMTSWLKSKKNILRFVYIKNSKIKLVDTPYNDVAIKRMSYCFHAKEINCCKVIPVINSELKMWCCISAGEDTVVNVSFFKKNEQMIMENVLNISQHLSSVRCMCLVKNNESNLRQYFLYTGGGRAQLCVTKIDLKESKIECFDLASYMLKGTDLDRRKKDKNWFNMQTDFDVETRFMNIVCLSSELINSDEFVHTLLIGCSDGLLRLYTVVHNEYENKCIFISEDSIDYHKKCILNVRCLKIMSKTIGLSFAVDGLVALWDLTKYIEDFKEMNKIHLEPFYTKKIHKAGINSCDIKIIDENNTIILATGGDDNALHINIFNFTDSEKGIFVKNISEWNCDKYHCSQITGITFCKDNLIIITSIDQRVTVVQWSFTDVVKCDFISQCYSSVPDVQGLHLLEDSGTEIQLCVFGKGIEIISINIST